MFQLAESTIHTSTYVNVSPVPNTTVSARVSVSVPQETAGHIWNAINSSNIGNAIVVSSSVTAGGVIASSVAGTPLAKIGTFMVLRFIALTAKLLATNNTSHLATDGT